MKALIEMLRSFGHAWRGVVVAFRGERSFRIQIAVGIGVISLSFILPLQNWERAFLWLATGAVLVLELVNSMVERIIDLVKPRMHQYVRDVKDLMAAAVLVASLFALMIGAMILWPHVVPLALRV